MRRTSKLGPQAVQLSKNSTLADRSRYLTTFGKEIDTCLEVSPAIKLEALRSISKTFQLMCQLPHSKLESALFLEQATKWVNVLTQFRALQLNSVDYSNPSYRLYGDMELTECSFHEVMVQNLHALSHFSAHQEDKELAKASNSLLKSLRECEVQEKKRIDQRSQWIQFHRKREDSSKLLPISRNLTGNILNVLTPLLPTADEIKIKEKVAQQIQTVLGAHVRLDFFGSSASGLGFSNADLDIALFAEDFPHVDTTQLSPDSCRDDVAYLRHETTEDPVAFMSKLSKGGKVVLLVADLIRAQGDEFVQVETVSAARVPVIKMVHRLTNTQCDLAVSENHELAVWNTKLLHAYANSSETVKHFILAIKLWAKRRRMADASEGFLSSYGWTLLALYYLQKKQFVANLQDSSQVEESDVVVKKIINTFPVYFASKGKNSKVDETVDVDALFRGFFSFYSVQFKMKSDMVHFQPLNGKTPLGWRFVIMDPFELTHDLGTTLSGKRAQVVLLQEIHKAHSTLLEPTTTFETLLSLPITSNIGGRICSCCGEPGHRSRACPRFAFVSTPSMHSGGGGKREFCKFCHQLHDHTKPCLPAAKTTRMGGRPSTAAAAVASPPRLNFTNLPPATATTTSKGAMYRQEKSNNGGVQVKKVSLLSPPRPPPVPVISMVSKSKTPPTVPSRDNNSKQKKMVLEFKPRHEHLRKKKQENSEQQE